MVIFTTFLQEELKKGNYGLRLRNEQQEIILKKKYVVTWKLKLIKSESLKKCTRML